MWEDKLITKREGVHVGPAAKARCPSRAKLLCRFFVLRHTWCKAPPQFLNALVRLVSLTSK
jgi:hypothetical protein